MKPTRPSLIVSTLVVALLAGLWGYLRLVLFQNEHFPLTFVLPLLVCVWSGCRWHVWVLAGLFSLMTVAKASWLFPVGTRLDGGYSLFLGSTFVNIVVGAAVVHALIWLRERLEHRNATISAQNAELEVQAEELSQQNEEIRAQAEELAEQNEEIEAQSEEVARQNEDLVDLNHRLAGREDILQGLLQAARDCDSIPRVLDELCRRTLSVIGAPAASLAVLEQRDHSLELLSQVSLDHAPPLPPRWPISNSIAAVVLAEKRTAYISDLTREQELVQPFDTADGFKSVLATPVSLAGSIHGLLVACSTQIAHWTEEQFRVMEWVASQCGLIIESLKNQQTLADHAKALESANHSKDTFLAMLSHELRTPLTPILVTSEMLEHDTRLPKDVRKSCQMIRRNVGIQSRLIDDLLDLTRLSRDRIEFERQTVPLAPLLHDTALIVANDLNAKSQQLKLDVEAIHSCTLVGDGPRLQQVFWNLLKNAVKFSDPRATITVLGRLEDQRVIVEVTDQGCGISPEDLHRIFLPFEQTRAETRNPNDRGLGLGLAIAKAIVEKHGGKISARSDGHGCGSTFVVDLPVAAPFDADPPTVAKPALQHDGHSNPVRILLVEDHNDTGRAIAKWLRTFECQVDRAECAAAAMHLFSHHHFDLVISDLGLPDESGLDLMRRFRALRPDLPGICISGFGMERDIEKCRDAGFRAHLTKPIDPHRLRSTIATLLGDPAHRPAP
jgi:signal transduction histidine kinase/ActR/RegA family two-component response regulator